MKNLIIVFGLFLASCNSNEELVYNIVDISDSLEIVSLKQKVDSLEEVALIARARHYNDSIDKRAINDTLFLYRARVKNIEKYINICKRNPTQKKFFFGWAVRAME